MITLFLLNYVCVHMYQTHACSVWSFLLRLHMCVCETLYSQFLFFLYLAIRVLPNIHLRWIAHTKAVPSFLCVLGCSSSLFTLDLQTHRRLLRLGGGRAVVLTVLLALPLLRARPCNLPLTQSGPQVKTPSWSFET